MTELHGEQPMNEDLTLRTKRKTHILQRYNSTYNHYQQDKIFAINHYTCIFPPMDKEQLNEQYFNVWLVLKSKRGDFVACYALIMNE
jgi:hypothetical protein